MSETVELEEKLRIANLAKDTLEQKRTHYKSESMLPGSTKETLKKLDLVSLSLENLMEAEAFKRVNNVLELAKTNVSTVHEMQVFNSNLTELNGSLVDVMVSLQSIETNLNVLTKTLTDDLTKQVTQRELEKETLLKLNKYLEDWV